MINYDRSIADVVTKLENVLGELPALGPVLSSLASELNPLLSGLLTTLNKIVGPLAEDLITTVSECLSFDETPVDKDPCSSKDSWPQSTLCLTLFSRFLTAFWVAFSATLVSHKSQFEAKAAKLSFQFSTIRLHDKTRRLYKMGHNVVVHL